MATIEKKPERKLTLEKWSLGVALTAVVASAAAAGGTFWQASESRQAVEAAETANRQASERFVVDVRPFVWLTNGGSGQPTFAPNPQDPHSGQVTWSWHFTNYGKSPALELRVTQWIRLGTGDFQLSYGSSENAEVGEPVPPNKDDFATAVSKPGLALDEFTRLLKTPGPDSVTMKIRIRYTDSANSPKAVYETGICQTRLNTGAIGYCPGGLNYMR